MALFGKKPKQSEVSDLVLPKHVGIIMDGNGRWAKKRGLPRKAGHTEGARTFRKITRYCSEIGIKYLTVYAFSTENWKRPEDEVGALMKLFKSYLEEAISDFKDDDIVVRFIGDKSGFSPELRALMDENEECSREREGMVLNIAMNYGSRDEIVRAVRVERIGHFRAAYLRQALYRGTARPRPDYPSERRVPHFKLYALAVGVHGVCDHEQALA